MGKCVAYCCLEYCMAIHMQDQYICMAVKTFFYHTLISNCNELNKFTLCTDVRNCEENLVKMEQVWFSRKFSLFIWTFQDFLDEICRKTSNKQLLTGEQTIDMLHS